MRIPGWLAGCVSLVLAAGCHSATKGEQQAGDGSAAADTGPDDASYVSRGGCPGPQRCCGTFFATCADGLWLCQGAASPPTACPADGGAQEAAAAYDGGDDGPVDSTSSIGCPGDCAPGAICVIAGYFRGDYRGTCQGLPAQCRLDGGADAGVPACSACIGAAVCSGTFQCFGAATKTYACGS